MNNFINICGRKIAIRNNRISRFSVSSSSVHTERQRNDLVLLIQILHTLSIKLVIQYRVQGKEKLSQLKKSHASGQNKHHH